jgi:hypothetical protein
MASICELAIRGRREMALPIRSGYREGFQILSRAGTVHLMHISDAII